MTPMSVLHKPEREIVVESMVNQHSLSIFFFLKLYLHYKISLCGWFWLCNSIIRELWWQISLQSDSTPYTLTLDSKTNIWDLLVYFNPSHNCCEVCAWMIEIITSFFFVVIFPPGNFVQPIGCPGSPAHSVVGWLRLKLVDWHFYGAWFTFKLGYQVGKCSLGLLDGYSWLFHS